MLGPTGFIHALQPGSRDVAMETTSPALTRAIADAHAGRDQLFLAATMFGRPEAAAKGELAILSSGPEPEQAMLMKLTGNHAILGMAEILALLKADGIGAGDAAEALFARLMPATPGVSPISPAWPVLAATVIGRKDNALLLEAARDLECYLPLARFLRAERMLADPG